MPNTLVRIAALLTAWTACCCVPAHAQTAPDQRSTPATAAQRAERDGLKRYIEAGMQSPDERLRVLINRIAILATDSGLTDRAALAADVLAEQTRGSTDAVVLALLIDACGNDRVVPRPTCDPVALATRWTVAETQNMVAWLTLSGTLQQRGDAPGARATFDRASQVSTWHEYYDDGTQAMQHAIPPSLGPRARYGVLQIGLASSAALLVPNTALHALSMQCSGDAPIAACTRIVEVAVRDAGSLMTRQMATQIGRRIGIDPERVAGWKRTSDSLFDTAMRSATKDLMEIDDPAELAAATTTLERRVALGEIGWLRASLADSGIAEDTAARHFRDYMAAIRARSASEAATAPSR